MVIGEFQNKQILKHGLGGLGDGLARIAKNTQAAQVGGHNFLSN
jgi:hypothetical protein